MSFSEDEEPPNWGTMFCTEDVPNIPPPVTFKEWTQIEESVRTSCLSQMAPILLDFLAVDVRTENGSYIHRCRPKPPARLSPNMRNWALMLSESMSADIFTRHMACTLTTEDLHISFDSWYSRSNITPCIAWSPSRVYFHYVCDGSDSVTSAPRDPCAGQCGKSEF